MLLYFLLLLNINYCYSDNISVIGSGYSGLVSSLELNKLGHNVTIYEKNDFIGGRSFSKKLFNNSVNYDV